MVKWNPQMVLFRDGKSCITQVYIWTGACFAGDPTAYCFREGQQVWLRPGESVAFVEV